MTYEEWFNARKIDQRIGAQLRADAKARTERTKTPAIFALLDADVARMRAQRDPEAEALDPRRKATR